LKEKCFDVFSERNDRTKYGEKDIIMNYTKYLMIQTLSVLSKLKRLALAGHLMHMNDKRTLKKILNTKLDDVSRVGRPKM
jgi:Holliday junction resolvase-like predicted endonuclease